MICSKESICSLLREVTVMCTWFYADSHSLSYFISKAQQLPLANEMMRKLGKNMAMSGNIRPTDTAAVLAPNKQGNMAVFPMV